MRRGIKSEPPHSVTRFFRDMLLCCPLGVPEVGVEPTRLAASEFESLVSAISPLRQLSIKYT